MSEVSRERAGKVKSRRIGTFYEEQGDHIKESVMKFIPSPELSGAVNAPYNPEQGQ